MKAIDELYKSLKDISFVKNNLDEKIDLVKKHIIDYNKCIQSKEIHTSQHEDIQNLLDSAVKSLKQSSNKFCDKVNSLLEKEKFRSDLENYFIIIIFGKVKAGKSSLGNFIAKHKPKDASLIFFKYDEAGKEQSIKKLEEINEDNFATNNLECTKEIQGFKLESMAWIDTPGLGSMVKENGDLALQYIQSADYIIYPTSSDSPLQQDEIAQIEELFQQNKKVTICITKSDYLEQDEVNNELVEVLNNKDAQRRLGQEDYVKDKIDNIQIDNKDSVLGDIISISTYTAQKGIDDSNEDMLKNSNMLKFYELITKVIKKKAKSLKEKTPHDTLNSFIENEIIGNNDKSSYSLKETRKAINDLQNQISENIEQFNILKKNATNSLVCSIDLIVSRFSGEITTSNSKSIFEKIDKEIKSKTSDTVDSEIQEIFQDFNSSLDKLVSIPDDAGNYEVQNQYKTISYTTRSQDGLGRAVKTFTFGIIDDVGVSSETHSEQVLIGDNKEEQIQNFKKSRVDSYSATAKDIYDKYQQSFFGTLESFVSDINKDLNEFENNIKKVIQ